MYKKIPYPLRHYLDKDGIKQCAIPLGGIEYLQRELPFPLKWVTEIFWGYITIKE